MPVQPRDESPLAVLDCEMEFPDMRGMTRWSERLPENEDSPLIAQYEAGQPLQRAAIAAGQGAIPRASALSLPAARRFRSPALLPTFPWLAATVDGQPARWHEPPTGSSLQIRQEHE
jgi:hypothetical protein